ncbi:unnamed protein product [Caenorhabditis bovis]|uniref:Uncharacterized protein n=1 Tax=Caenorhabditis bovis TaxID=2654633 RepID=A0A8S1EVZ8_9PELO|nr:unnamed protein product [Caenorhabditis bovis]
MSSPATPRNECNGTGGQTSSSSANPDQSQNAQGRRLFNTNAYSDESDVSIDNDDRNGAETDGSSSSRGCLKSERSRKDQPSTSSGRPPRTLQQVTWSFAAKQAPPHSQPPGTSKKGAICLIIFNSL